MRQMPTGQYLPGDSFLHRLDGRSKLVSLFLILAAVIGAADIWGYLLVIPVIGAGMAATKLPLRVLVGQVVRLKYFFIIIMLMNAFFFESADPIFSFWIFTLSIAGIKQGLTVAANLLLILMAGNLLTLTTPPMEITSALERLMAPLGLIGIPTGEIAMILTVALQFIPTLMEETEMIRMAQTARGARFESKNLLEKAADLLPLVVPIFLSAFRRADELAMAMEARGYRGAKGRTKKNKRPMKRNDRLLILFCSGICVVQFLFI